jgi:hypothetical protein
MVASRTCEFVMPDGSRCRAGPQRERPFCFAHDPERAAQAAEARKLGGLRRRKEGTIVLAYDLPGLETVAGIRRLLQIVSTDGLAMDNGVPRLRVLISTAVAATNLLKVGEIEERLAALESATGGHKADEAEAFPAEAIR